MIICHAARQDNALKPPKECRSELQATVVSVSTVESHLADAMYRLYAENYQDTSRAVFGRDLAEKSHVLLLTEDSDGLCGFSTLQLYSSRVSGEAVRVIYSGDTIIDPRYWGSSVLAFEWLRFAGRLQREMPATSLYWLLIVKGHRTYRFLATFARHYVPHHRADTTSKEQALLDSLAVEKFGDAYDSATGIVRFASPQGRLTDALAEVPERHRRLQPVAHFLKLNPGYRRGDELVCLCELSAKNLKPLAARVFASGRPVR